MLTQIKYENYPEHVVEEGLHHVNNAGGLHPIEHEDQGKEAWIQQYVVTDNYTKKQKPSRRIGGLKPWLFWFILAIVGLIVIGASVGGAVGGTLAAKSNSSVLQQSPGQNSSTPTPTSTTPPPPSTSVRSAIPLSTSTPIPLITTDCPSSNGTSFTPKSPGGNAGKYTFTKQCGFDTNGTNLVSAFVTDLDLCIALCSNWNYQQTGGDKCNSVSFNVDGSPPGNCWAKTGTGLKVVDGQGAAVLG